MSTDRPTHISKYFARNPTNQIGLALHYLQQIEDFTWYRIIPF